MKETYTGNDPLVKLAISMRYLGYGIRKTAYQGNRLVIGCEEPIKNERTIVHDPETHRQVVERIDNIGVVVDNFDRALKEIGLEAKASVLRGKVVVGSRSKEALDKFKKSLEAALENTPQLTYTLKTQEGED